MEKQFVKVNEAYRNPCSKQGVIESLNYPVPNLENGKTTKHCNVYLPYGYNESDIDKKYNILYLMHGGGEDENLLFGGPGENRALKNILDHMISEGEIDPLIVVTPTFYGVKNSYKNDPFLSRVEGLDHPLPLIETEFFHDELIQDLIPFVETRYNTYVEVANRDELKRTRNHRAFGGFSMGSVTTWNVFIHCLDSFKYFMPLSGDCWALAQKAEGEKAKETALFLAKIAKDGGFSTDDYCLFCATGAKDIAYPNMKPQMDELKKLTESFIEKRYTENGNFYFIECEEGDHTWHWVHQYIFDILPDLFKK